MDHFHYQHHEFYAENVSIRSIAEQYGTPCYVYSRATLEHHWRVFDQAFGQFPHLICYAVKANSNLAVLNLFARLGSGFDVVSIGELERVLAAGGDPNKIIFSGIGKQRYEMQCALNVGIGCFNVESAPELALLNQVAKEMNALAPVSIRINPNVDPKTHPYISTGLKENKFGVAMDEARALYLSHAQYPYVDMIGIDCHIGSQLTELTPFLTALNVVIELYDELKKNKLSITHIDLGGGLGVRYKEEIPPHPEEYIAEIKKIVGDRNVRIILEPGRAIAANAGILVTKVVYVKSQPHKNFVIVDAAMNDLMRPALYQSWQNILPVINDENGKKIRCDVVGPVCETADFLGKDRVLSVQSDDLLVIRTAGAYGFTMSSNYNSRPRVAEIMVDGHRSFLIRERETIESLFAFEKILP